MAYSEKTLSELILIIICLLAAILIIFDNVSTLSLTSWITLQTIENDINFIKSLQSVNELLLDTETLRNDIHERSAIHVIYLYLGIILTVAIIIIAYLYHRSLKKEYSDFDDVTKKWRSLPKPKILITILLASFIAISLTFLSSMNNISMIKIQTISQMVAATLENRQGDVILGILGKYLQTVNEEFYRSVSGFVYFSIASLFPLIGLIIYKIKNGLNLWTVAMFYSPLASIPFWIIFYGVL